MQCIVPEAGKSMSEGAIRILLTGPPGCGKTTAVMKIVRQLDKSRMAGFHTEEIREGARRTGFRWARLDGPSGTLAHFDIRGPHRVGRYGVDIAAFNHEVVPILDPATTEAKLFVIDEIGKMECLSETFVQAVRRLFASDRAVLATAAQKGGGFIREVKSYRTVKLLHLTVENRDEVTQQVMDMLGPSPK